MSVGLVELHAALLINAQQMEDEDLHALAGEAGVDPEALWDMAMFHSGRWLEEVGDVVGSRELLCAVWIEAFLTGVKIGHLFPLADEEAAA